MKRKFKDGYYCAIDYRSKLGNWVTPATRALPEHLQTIADSDFKKDYEGTDLLDIRFYSPENKKVSMEEATEVAKVKKEGWINIYSDGTCGSYIFSSKEDADIACGYHRIDCVLISWEV